MVANVLSLFFLTYYSSFIPRDIFKYTLEIIPSHSNHRIRFLSLGCAGLSMEKAMYSQI